MDNHLETINKHINDDVEAFFVPAQKAQAEVNAEAMINYSQEKAMLVFQFIENLIQNIEDTGTYTYIGLAQPQSTSNQPVWRIKRIDAVGNIRFAGGVTTFTQIWDNRTSLSYS